MLRDAFGAALDDCSECRHSERLHGAVMCAHPQAVRINDRSVWLASCARDYACQARWFVRRRKA